MVAPRVFHLTSQIVAGGEDHRIERLFLPVRQLTIAGIATIGFDGVHLLAIAEQAAGGETPDKLFWFIRPAQCGAETPACVVRQIRRIGCRNAFTTVIQQCVGVNFLFENGTLEIRREAQTKAKVVTLGFAKFIL